MMFGYLSKLKGEKFKYVRNIIRVMQFYKCRYDWIDFLLWLSGAPCSSRCRHRCGSPPGTSGLCVSQHIVPVHVSSTNKKSLWQHFLQRVEVGASRQTSVFGSFQLDEQLARLVLGTFGFGVGALNESPRLVRLLSAVQLLGKPGQLLSRLHLSLPIQLLLQVVALRQALVQS